MDGNHQNVMEKYIQLYAIARNNTINFLQLPSINHFTFWAVYSKEIKQNNSGNASPCVQTKPAKNVIKLICINQDFLKQ